MLGFGEGATFPTATRAMQNWVAQFERDADSMVLLRLVDFGVDFVRRRHQ
jgi:hypothetical protein